MFKYIHEKIIIKIMCKIDYMLLNISTKQSPEQHFQNVRDFFDRRVLSADYDQHLCFS